ncbi:MAG: putative zinc-binding metallopeptidase [Chthoniobacter sp.]|uniref:zinc-binding metallopeptidase family protein n=1 Tax=Chthoniobacter sp. TaxID=2510640 RepID=UPI0032A32938
MRHYQCSCGNILFFDNSACTQCGTQVGYDSAHDQMVTLTDDSTFQRCTNGTQHGICNWVVPRGKLELLCPSCLLNRTIPELAVPGNLDAWHKIEIAKRRILYTMGRLGLTPVSKREDAVNGLAFDFLRPTPGGTVLTGHEDGLITLNVDEAEDLEREKRKEALGESYRTLIGHFRHEIAHYYWDRFFANHPDDEPNLVAFREVFGDEREDYNAALQRHYTQGPVAAAPGTFITTYASVHPWEDWAETWAHYMHMIDGTETARSFGLDGDVVPIPFTPFPTEAVTLPNQLAWPEGEKEEFLTLLRDWAKLSPAINEIVASLGHPAFYPFVFSDSIIRKFFFVHHMVKFHGGSSTEATQPPVNAAPEPVTA